MNSRTDAEQKIKKKVILTVALCLFMILLWITEFRNMHEGRQEISVPAFDSLADEREFVALFDQIHNIVVSADNGEYDTSDMTGVDIEVTITGADNPAECWTLRATDQSVHRNGYTSTESTFFEGLPVSLTQGNKYIMSYKAVDASGRDIYGLSFMLYGDRESTDAISACFLVIITAALLLLIWHGNYVPLWIVITASTLFFMPVLMSEDVVERTAFADCYSMSSAILHRPVIDEQGYAFIEEDGIRNIGFTSYSVPIMRFWTDHNYGSERTGHLVSSRYKCSDNRMRLVNIPATLAVTFARSLNAPYQIVLLSGWLMNAVITVLLFMLSRRIFRPYDTYHLFDIFCFLPSVVVSIYSYTGLGVGIGLCMLIAVMVWRALSGYQGTDVSVARRYVTSCGVLLIPVIICLLLSTYPSRNPLDALKYLLMYFDELFETFVTYQTLNHDGIIIPTFALLTVFVGTVLVSLYPCTKNVNEKRPDVLKKSSADENIGRSTELTMFKTILYVIPLVIAEFANTGTVFLPVIAVVMYLILLNKVTDCASAGDIESNITESVKGESRNNEFGNCESRNIESGIREPRYFKSEKAETLLYIAAVCSLWILLFHFAGI